MDSMASERNLGAEVRNLLRRATPIFNRATTTNTTSEPSSTVAPYATDLNGVNQPLDKIFTVTIWWSLGIVGLVILCIRIWQRYKAHMRHLAAMSLSATQQTYFSKHSTSWSWKFKKNLLYAPLKNKRHNREIRLSSAMNMGTIPSRFHTILLAAFWLSNIGYCIALDWKQANHYEVAAELRGRSGVLAVVNMIGLVIFAGRNNPLISLLQISFDTYNLLHRWTGRIVVLEALVHTACWAYVKHDAAGWSGAWHEISTVAFAGWGFVATISMVLIAILSLSPVRHAFYETFLDIHIILAAAAMIGIYIHCDRGKLPQLLYIEAIVGLWVADRLVRMLRIVWYNYSRKSWTTATIESLPGEASRVTLHLPRKVNIKPGSHAYLRFSSIKPWESHPFSIAWVEHKPANGVLPITEKGVDFPQLKDSETVTDVSFVIHAQTGMTRRLFQAASNVRPRVLTLKAAFEGPYGGHHSLDSYGHSVLFAGSSGITHQVPFVRHLIEGFNQKTVATRKITLIWIVRDSEHLEWVRPWMDTILRMPGRRDVLTIKLFVTRPKNPREINSPSNTVQMYPGRPNVKLLLEAEIKNQVGACCVTVCGPGGLQDNVREAIREVQELGVVDFLEESFTW